MENFIYEFKSDDFHFQYRDVLQFRNHLHPHIELVIMQEGETHAYADTKGGLLTAGHAFITFPNQVHSYVDDRGPFRCQLLIFSPELLPTFHSLFRKKVPVEPIIPVDLAVLRPVLDMLAAEAESEDKFARPVVEGCLQILLAHLFRATAFEDVNRHNIAAIRAVLDYCNEHYTEPLTLETLAKSLHLSRYYISHVFNLDIGMTLPAYLNMLRVHDAKELLREGNMSVTEVAFAVGFRSLRSFNRSFVALTGCTPTAFRQEADERP